MYPWSIFIVLIVGVVRGSSDVLVTCKNVLMKEQDGNSTFKPIHLLSSCPASFRNREIRQKCENLAADDSIVKDIFLFTLVRGMKSELPYANMYCAICHDEIEFYNFPPYLTFHTDEKRGFGKDVDGNKINVEFQKRSLIGNFTLNQPGNELISIFNDSKFKVRVIRNIQVHNNSQDHHLTQRTFHQSDIIHCNLSSGTTDEVLCQKKSSIGDPCQFKLEDEVVDLFVEVENLYKSGYWTPNKTAFFPQTVLPKLGSCKYADKNGDHCLWNEFLVKGVEFAFGENGDIFLMKNGTKFDAEQYTNETDFEDVIYLCKPKKKLKNQYCIQIMNSISSTSRRLSLFFVVLYLIINANYTYLSSLADRYTYSYYITLLIMYIRDEFTEWWSDEEECFLKYYAYRCLSQSYAIWILICSSYVWYIIRFSKEEITTGTTSRKGHMKIYLTACLFGWITPVIFSIIFYYLEFSPSCPYIDGYYSLRICQRPDYKDPYYWFSAAIMITVSTTVVVLFSNSCYYYYFAKSIYNRYCKFDTLRARMVFLFKIVYSIGLYSMLVLSSLLNFSDSTYAMLIHLWSFHGTVIFFVYSFKMAFLKQMFKNKCTAEENGPVSVPVRRKNNLIGVRGNGAQNVEVMTIRAGI